MASLDSELADMLKQGIAAAKAGDAEMARDLLTRVVERDERNVKAWLWLSEVVTNPDDRQVCLENVLALEPNNSIAQRGLALLHKQQAARPSVRIRPPSAPSYAPGTGASPSLASAVLHEPHEAAPVEPAPDDSTDYVPPSLEESYTSSSAPSPTMAAAILRPSPPSPDEAYEAPMYMAPALAPSDYAARPTATGPMPVGMQAESRAGRYESDEDYLCPYCAEATQPDDKLCPACQGQLWQTVRRLAKRSNLLWLASLSLAMASGWSLFGFAAWGFFTIQPLFNAGKVSLEQFVGLYLGLNTMPPDLAAAFLKQLPVLSFWLTLSSAAIMLVLAALIYLRWRPIYWVSLALAGMLLIYTGAEAIFNFNLWSAGRAVLALLIVGLLASIHDDFMLDRKRILCELDKDISSHSGFYMHGREYARQKMWALAAIHFQRATAEAPGMLAYHLALARALTRLKHYERARSALGEAQRLAPDHPNVRKMAELIDKEEVASGNIEQEKP